MISHSGVELWWPSASTSLMQGVDQVVQPNRTRSPGTTLCRMQFGETAGLETRATPGRCSAGQFARENKTLTDSNTDFHGCFGRKRTQKAQRWGASVLCAPSDEPGTARTE